MAKLNEWEKETIQVREKLLELRKRISSKEISKNVVKQFPAGRSKTSSTRKEERTTHEQQLVEMINRQVRDKRSKTKWDEKLKKKEELKKQIRETPTTNSQALGPSPHCPRPSSRPIFRSGLPELLFPEKRNGNFSRIPISSQVARSANQRDRTWDHRSSSCLGQLDHFSREPPLHPGHRKPRLAEAFRQGTRRKLPTILVSWAKNRPIRNCWIGWPPHSSKGGWKLKDLHRTIMLSDTYGQTTRREPSEKEKVNDPENRLLWRFSCLNGFMQNKSGMLAASGELKPKSGGSSVDGNSPLRSIYVKKRRNSPDPILAAFDAPAGFASASERLDTYSPRSRPCSYATTHGPMPEPEPWRRNSRHTKPSKSPLGEFSSPPMVVRHPSAEIELARSFSIS